MVQFQWYAKEEARRAVDKGGPAALIRTLRHAVRSAPTARRDEPVAIIATDGRVVARQIFFTYGYITDGGAPLRVAAAQALATDPAFRGQGIGSGLIDETRRARYPCIYSGISEEALGLYLKLGCRFIDEAPIYRIPLGGAAALAEWRDRYYEGAAAATGPLTALRETTGVRARCRRAANAGWRVLAPADALMELERIDRIPCRRFQVPRNLERVRAALQGEAQERRALVVEHPDLGPESRRLVTIDLRRATVRLPGTRWRRAFAEGHVVEIGPPVLDTDTAVGIVSCLARQAPRLGIGALAVHAMTDALAEACRRLGARSRWSRHTAIEPMGVPPAQADAMRQPDNWWCRAASEEHFEEAVAGSAADGAPAA